MDRNGNDYEVIASRRSSVTASPHKSLLAATKPFELMKLAGIRDVPAYVGNKLSVKGRYCQ